MTIYFPRNTLIVFYPLNSHPHSLPLSNSASASAWRTGAAMAVEEEDTRSVSVHRCPGESCSYSWAVSFDPSLAAAAAVVVGVFHWTLTRVH